ncbi:transglutaminase-like domain-containing protein [Micromonospora matsumotoense]|uniref:transglutaminase-like domain-containing protein n=1 Tax=Micromonospora matsumotoense TaxID=121616 RepID=UPI003410AC47
MLNRPDEARHARDDAGPAARGSRPDRWQLGRALVGVGLAATAVPAFAPAFGVGPGGALTDWRYGPVLLGAIGLVTASTLLFAAGTRLAPVNRLAVTLGVLVGFVLLVVAPGWAIVRATRQLLSAALPLEPAGPEFAVVALVVGAATLGAVEPALRRRAALLPLVAPLLAVTAGLSVSAPAVPPPGWLAPAVAVGAAGLLVLGRLGAGRPAGSHPGPPPAGGAGGEQPAAPASRAPYQRLVGVLTAVGLTGLVVVAGGVGAELLAPAGRTAPAEARQFVTEPVEPRTSTSPLALFPALLSGKRPFSVTVTSSQPPQRLRYVTLESFDGTLWSTGARYRHAGTRFPPGPAAGSAEHRTELIRVNRPEVVGWLLSSGRPTEVSVAGLAVDEASGDVVVPAGQPVPAQYRIDSVVGVVDEERRRVSVPAAGPAESAFAAPEDLRTWARQVAGGERSYAALERLAGHFADYRLETAEPPGGHGLYQIRELRRTRVGTAEQYASAFAVLARTLGYDVRVVVGFRPRPTGEAGRYRAEGRDVHAWAEVRFDGVGWLDFDPTPTRTVETEGADEPAPEQPERRPSAEPTPGARAARTADPPAAGATDARPGGGDTPWPVGVAVLVGVVLLVGAAVPVAKSIRRRRRRGAVDPGRRALGAWRETVERLLDGGVAVTRSQTVGEVVGTVQGRFDESVAHAVRRLGRLHEEAAFAPGGINPSAADLAWTQADLIRAAVLRQLPPLARLRALLNPRSLGSTPR